jgi:hypothetical protein
MTTSCNAFLGQTVVSTTGPLYFLAGKSLFKISISELPNSEFSAHGILRYQFFCDIAM